jgi:hypothetical protein
MQTPKQLRRACRAPAFVESHELAIGTHRRLFTHFIEHAGKRIEAFGEFDEDFAVRSAVGRTRPTSP